MPMDENLRTRGCIIVSVCSLCLSSNETSDHIFFSCVFAKELCDLLGAKLHCVMECSAVLSLLSFRPNSCSSQVSDIYMAAVVHTLHTIWWARNSMCFVSISASTNSAKVHIHSLVVMPGYVSKGKCLPSDFAFLDSLEAARRTRKIKEITMVLWKKPIAPWSTVNTDGLVIGASAACEGLFRDHLGTFRGYFTCTIRLLSIFDAEILGFNFAIEYAARKGWTNIWLEGISTSAIRIFSNASSVLVMLRNRWHNARSLGVQVISYIYCEGNSCADKLANMGHSVQGLVWLSSFPFELNVDFFQDICGLPNYKFP